MEFWSIASLDQKVKRLKKYFNRHVLRKKGNACWDWCGTLLDGRGRLSFEKKQIQAHRAAWMIYRGMIPPKMYVCHTCDNKICTNPRHLFLGTAKENSIDAARKGRQHRSVLSIRNVLSIKRMLNNGRTGVYIAKKYGISTNTVSDIKNGRTWSHLNDLLPYT